LNIQSFGVVNSRVVLTNSGNNSSFLLKELGGPVSDGTESLDNEGLVSASESETDFVDETLSSEKLLNGVENTKSGRFGTALNTSLLDIFSSAASFGVDILFTSNLLVGIFNPGHNLLVGSHIGSKAIDGSSDKALLDELHSVLAGDTFELTCGESFGVDLHSSLGSTERYISDSELEGHERGKGLDFLQIDVRRVAGTSFDGKLVS
jgi:hypothetical protein